MNRTPKDKPSYWLKKLTNMRRAKDLRPKNMRQREMREEELWKLTIKHGASPTN